MARPSDPNTKIGLLQAAEAVFVEHGLDRARVEEITGRAGCSKGSFYLHFQSKEDAFRQIVETSLARLASFLDEHECALPSRIPSVQAYLDEALEKDVEIFDFLWQNRGLMRLVLEGGGGAGYGYLMDEFAERSRNNIQRAIAHGIKLGIYRPDVDLGLASLVIAGAYDRVARELVHLPARPDLVAWLRGVRDLVLGGIGDPAVIRAARLADSKVRNSQPAALSNPTGVQRRGPGSAVSSSARPAKSARAKRSGSILRTKARKA